MPALESVPPQPPIEEPELDSHQGFFFKVGIRNPDLANTYLTLFNLVQTLRPQAFEGYVNTKSGFWYQVTFGWLRSENDESSKSIEAYRGYLQLDPQDIGRIVQQLSLIALERLRASKRTEFKVMLGTNPEITHKYQPKEPLALEDLAKIGTYNDLSPNDTALAI